ncbi:MAG: alpha/beta hydrolase [Ktedonobacteraceae bacterium]
MQQKKFQELVDQFIDVNDTKMHFMTNRDAVDAGEQVIIFVHGLTVSYRYMCPVASELADTYRVYIPDLPGFGKSAKPANALNLDELADALAQWMDVIMVDRAVFVGNSLGCQILARLALRHPERVTHLVFTGPTMDTRARTAHQEITRWLINVPREPPSLYPIVIKDAFDLGLRRLVQTFRSGLQDDITEHLPHIHMPTLVVRGSWDTVAPQRWTEEVARLLPRGRLVVIPHAAHDLNYNAPRRLARCIRAFLINDQATS